MTTRLAAWLAGMSLLAACGTSPPVVEVQACRWHSDCPADMECSPARVCRYLGGCWSDDQCWDDWYCMEDGACHAGVPDTTGWDLFLAFLDAIATAADSSGSQGDQGEYY